MYLDIQQYYLRKKRHYFEAFHTVDDLGKYPRFIQGEYNYLGILNHHIRSLLIFNKTTRRTQNLFDDNAGRIFPRLSYYEFYASLDSQHPPYPAPMP